MPDTGQARGLEGGTVWPILTQSDPILRTRCAPAGYLPADDQHRLARDLLATLHAADGQGLAAPQIGVSRRILVLDAGRRDGAPSPLVMLDPEIVARSDDRVEETERCLSCPGARQSVPRASSIEICWYDLDGVRQHRLLSGSWARIVQHQIDHLDGRLIVDIPG